MLIKQIIDNPKKSLIYMERYVNDGSPSGFTWINQTSYETSPVNNSEFFFLDSLYTEELEVVGELPSFFTLFGKDIILIHPDMSYNLMKSGIDVKQSSLKVCPTSSSRTVKLLDFPGYVKLNYNGIIGRIDRSLTDKHVYASIEMTECLHNVVKNDIFSKLSFFPESGALIYKDEKRDINMGMVYREENPVGKNVNNINFMIPLFSLFSFDKTNEDEVLIVQLIKKSCIDPEKYILDNLIFIIIDNYFNLLLEEGIQPEWHAQNLLLGIDEKFLINSLIMRDLESIDIDKDMRELIGKKKIFNCYPYKYLSKEQYNYKIKHSFMYDFKIGEYVLNPIIKCVSRYFNLNELKITRKVKEYSQQYIEKLPSDFFPPNGDWYSFKNVVIDRSVPYRPYVKNCLAKFR